MMRKDERQATERKGGAQRQELAGIQHGLDCERRRDLTMWIRESVLSDATSRCFTLFRMRYRVGY
jgi:hypothetical protein